MMLESKLNMDMAASILPGVFAAGGGGAPVETSFDNWESYRTGIALSKTSNTYSRFNFGSLGNWFNNNFAANTTGGAILNRWRPDGALTMDVGSEVVIDGIRIYINRLGGSGTWADNVSQQGDFYGSNVSDFSDKTLLVQNVEWQRGGRITTGGDVEQGDLSVSKSGNPLFSRIYSCNSDKDSFRYYRFEHTGVDVNSLNGYWYTSEFQFRIGA